MLLIGQASLNLLLEVFAKQQRELRVGNPRTVRTMACLAWCHSDPGFPNIPLLKMVLEAASDRIPRMSPQLAIGFKTNGVSLSPDE